MHRPPSRRALPLPCLWLGGALLALAAPLGAQAGNGGASAPPPAPNVPPPPPSPSIPPSPKDTNPSDKSSNPDVDRPRPAAPPPGASRPVRRRPVGPPDPTPAPGHTGVRPPTGDQAPDRVPPRNWETWWALHRDRLLRTRARDLALDIVRIPPDPRTSVLATNVRAGSFERVTPSLKHLLAHERSELVVARALMALAKVGEDPRQPGSTGVYATILPYIHHADSALREAAITALGILGTENALFPLGEIADGARRSSGEASPTRERALALYAMGLIGRDSRREDVRRLAASRVCALFTQDADAPAEVKFAALHALSLIPIRVEEPSAAPELPAATAKARSFSERRAARRAHRAPTRVLPSASRAAEVDWVLAVLDDPDEEGWIRAQAATAAARLCAELPDGSACERKVVQRLLASLAERSRDPLEIQQAAALGLGELGDADSDELDARVRATLAYTVAQGSDQTAREFALLGLAQVGARAGGRPGEPDRLAASEDVRKLLLHRAVEARSTERPWAVLALGLFEHGMHGANPASARETRLALANLLAEERSSEVAAACCLAAGLARAGEAKAELRARLEDGDASVRGFAALALGMVQAREAAPAIERLLEEARQAPDLYRSASEALEMLGAPVSRQLVGLLGDGSSLESQMNLCSALGRVGDGTSLRALSQVACDRDNLLWVRAAATSALGTLGARRTDWQADLGHALNFTAVPPTLKAPSLDGLLDLD